MGEPAAAVTCEPDWKAYLEGCLFPRAKQTSKLSFTTGLAKLGMSKGKAVCDRRPRRMGTAVQVNGCFNLLEKGL